MKKTAKEPDALIGRRVRINDNSSVWPGREGTVVRAHKDRGYEVDFGDGSTYWFQMAEFSVLPNEAGGTPGSQLIEADPYLVAFSLTNPRKRRGLDIDSLNALAANIKAIGLGQPITVRPLPGSRTPDTFLDRNEGHPLPIYELVCGERRLRACRIAGLPTMPMLVRDLTDAQALELQLVENIEREDLDPLEEAEGFEQLRERCGYTVDQIADHIAQGKGPSYVRKSLKLLDLTPDSREALFAGHLGRSTALLVARYPAEQQPEVIAFIVNHERDGEPLPYREIAPRVHQRFNLALKVAVWALDDAELVAAAGACSACPKRTGAQAEIFGDDNAEDSCTDPDCFAGKRAAHVERVKAQAAKDGFKVIADDEARRLAPSPFARYIEGHARLTDVAYTEEGNDGVEREVTFEDALRKLGKKAPKPRLFINPHTGAAEKVISNELAERLTPKDPEGDAPQGQASGRGARPDTRTPEEIALKNFEVRRATMLRILAAIRTGFRTTADMLLITRALWFTSEDVPCQVEAYLGWSDLADMDDNKCRAEVAARLEAMPSDQLAQVAVMAAAEFLFLGFQTDSASKLRICEQYGIDILAVRDKVAEDLGDQPNNAQGQEAEADEEVSA